MRKSRLNTVMSLLIVAHAGSIDAGEKIQVNMTRGEAKALKGDDAKKLKAEKVLLQEADSENALTELQLSRQARRDNRNLEVDLEKSHSHLESKLKAGLANDEIARRKAMNSQALEIEKSLIEQENALLKQQNTELSSSAKKKLVMEADELNRSTKHELETVEKTLEHAAQKTITQENEGLDKDLAATKLALQKEESTLEKAAKLAQKKEEAELLRSANKFSTEEK